MVAQQPFKLSGGGSNPLAPTKFKIMKYKIESNDKNEFYYYLKGPEFHSVLEEIVRQFRSKARYCEDSPPSWDDPYELLLDILNERNVDIYNTDEGFRLCMQEASEVVANHLTHIGSTPITASKKTLDKLQCI